MNKIYFDNFTIKENVQKKILIVGLGNIGFNIAKNLIISNLFNLTFRDSEVFTNNDINDLVTEKFVKTNRAEGYKKIIESFHDNANIEILSDTQINFENIKNFSVIIITEQYSNEIVTINELARKNNIKLLMVETLGLYGYIFADYGDHFVTNNQNGKIEKSGKIKKIFDSHIETEYSQDLEVNDKIYIKLNDIDGEIICSAKIIEISNNNTIFKLKNFGKLIKKYNIIYTDDSDDLYFIEIKRENVWRHLDFVNSMTTPTYSNIDKNDKQNILHWFTFATKNFVEKYKKIPESLYEIEKIKKMIFLVDKTVDIEKINYKKILKYMTTTIALIDKFFSGIVSYEILKIINNIGTPINQWLYLDFSKSYLKLDENTIFNIPKLDYFGIENIINLIQENNKNIIISDNEYVELADLHYFTVFEQNDYKDLKIDIIKRKFSLNKKNNYKKNEITNLSNMHSSGFKNNVFVKNNSISGTLEYNPDIINDDNEKNILEISDNSFESIISWAKNILIYFFYIIPSNFTSWKKNNLNKIKKNEYEFIIKNYSLSLYEIVEFGYKFWKFLFKKKEIDDDDLYLITIICNIWCTVCSHESLTLGLVNQLLEKINNNVKSPSEIYSFANDISFNCINGFNHSIVPFDYYELNNIEIYYGFIKYMLKIKLKENNIFIDDLYIKKIDILYSSYIINMVMSTLSIITCTKYITTNKKIEINLMENSYDF